MKTSNTFLVVIKDGDERVKNLALPFIRSSAKKYNVLMLPDQAESAGFLSLSANEKEIKKAKFIVSIGGDGTMLRSARKFSKYALAIIGVNLGRRGFLTETTLDKIQSLLPKIFAGNFYSDERIMLDVVVKNGKKVKKSGLALNDIVVGKSGIARVIELKAYIDENFITSYRGDGLIVSTPTGSTGHNLSAGGPILDSSLSAFVLTAICPLSISHRPIVLTGSEQLRVVVHEAPGGMDMMLTCDGQFVIPLETGDEIFIKRSAKKTRFIRFNKYSFFTVLKERLGWGILK